MTSTTANPFKSNPLSRGVDLKLVTIPDAPETHEARKPLRTYLSPGGGGLSLDGLLGSGQRPKKPLEVIKTVYRNSPHSDDQGDD